MDADKKRIWIRGQFVEVTDEVYRAYMQGDRKMRYFENDLKTERFVLGKEGQVVQIIPSREDSLDRLEDENAQQFSDEQESVESVVLHKLEVDRLHTALSLLAPEERALIQALFFDERKESELAMELGITIAFAPKYRRMAIYGQIRKDIGQILRKLCEQKGVEIIEAQACPDHIHMLLSIPPKYSVSQIMGYLKGKSSLMIFYRHANLKYKYGDRHFWQEDIM